MRSYEATTEMSESAHHDLADAWIGSLEESLEALDDVLDDFDISNAVRLRFAGQTTLLEFFRRSKACSTSSLASTVLMFSTNKRQTVKFGGLHQSGMLCAHFQSSASPQGRAALQRPEAICVGRHHRRRRWRGTRDGAELLSLLCKELQELLPGFSLNVPEVRQEAGLPGTK